jgi:hypothetical protein
MFLPTNHQAVSHKRKALLFFTIPLLARFSIYGLLSTPYHSGHPEYDKGIKECYGSWVQQRYSEALWPCQLVYRVRRDVCCRLRSNKVVFLWFQFFINLVLKLCSRTVISHCYDNTRHLLQV